MFNAEKPDPLDKGKALFRRIREGLEKEDYDGLISDAERMIEEESHCKTDTDDLAIEEDEFVKKLRPIEENEKAMKYRESRPDLY